MVRRELREHVFKMLFQIEFNEKEDMPEHMLLYFDHLENATESDLTHIKEKYETIVNHITEIDAILNERTTGWTTSRMSKVDLTILRLAVYELKWDEGIPDGVAINEAVELAKRFSGEEGPAFVNGVLAKLTN